MNFALLFLPRYGFIKTTFLALYLRGGFWEELEYVANKRNLTVAHPLTFIKNNLSLKLSLDLSRVYFKLYLYKYKMKLENQGNSDKRINQAIDELDNEIKREMRKSLWD